MYRPLSPHILIYRAQLSSIFSIFHRVTGIILTGLIAIIWLFLCLNFITSLHAHYILYIWTYNFNTHFTWISVVILTLISISLLYHILGGIRHLIWDFYSSWSLTKTNIKKNAYFILIISVILILYILIF